MTIENKAEDIREMRKLLIEILIKHEGLKQKGFTPEDFQAFKKKINDRLASIERIVELQKKLVLLEEEDNANG